MSEISIKQYVGDIIGGSLFISESRTIAELMLQGLSEADMRFAVEEDNVLQKNSPKTAVRYARTIRLRLEPMGTSFLEFLVTANQESTKQLLMAAFLNQAPIARDFMRHKLTDARRTFQERLSDDAWMEFVDERIRVLPELGKFSESSIKKMGNNMMKALADAGYINNARQKKLQTVYLDSDVRAWLTQQGHNKLAQIMEA